MTLPKRIQVMHKAYGLTPGQSCGKCVHLEDHSRGNHWFKCGLTTPGGPATDWRKFWPACGKFVLRAP